MWDNRTNKKNPKAPDWKCKNDTCRFQLDRKTNEWVKSEYVTSVWERDLPKGHVAQARAADSAFVASLPQEEKPPVPPQTEPHVVVTDEQEVWERKDRTSMAQTSLNASATVYQGRDIEAAKLLTYANTLYGWLTTKRNTR
jgi:hypothetical protein